MMLAAQGINIVINVDVSIWNFGYALKCAHALAFIRTYSRSSTIFKASETINYYTESNQLRSFFCLFLAYVLSKPKLLNNNKIFG